MKQVDRRLCFEVLPDSMGVSLGRFILLSVPDILSNDYPLNVLYDTTNYPYNQRQRGEEVSGAYHNWTSQHHQHRLVE